LPAGEDNTVEDLLAAQEGFAFDIGYTEFAPNPYVPVRYFRFVPRETFGGTDPSGVDARQLTFWAVIQ
jgi:hypothetical protein